MGNILTQNTFGFDYVLKIQVAMIVVLAKVPS